MESFDKSKLLQDFYSGKFNLHNVKSDILTLTNAITDTIKSKQLFHLKGRYL